jgi:hypothetical protein
MTHALLLLCSYVVLVAAVALGVNALRARPKAAAVSR